MAKTKYRSTEFLFDLDALGLTEVMPSDMSKARP